jgi:hypothetical protein
MRRIAVTVGGLLVALLVLLSCTLRVLDCADCGGVTGVNCGRCSDTGRISLLNRALRRPPDGDLRRLLVHGEASRSDAPDLFDDALYSLFERSSRPILTPGDRPLRVDFARWAGSEAVLVGVPRWPFSEGAAWIGLFDRQGKLRDERLFQHTLARTPLGLQGDGATLRLSWPQTLFPSASGAPWILSIREPQGSLRFRMASAVFPAGMPVARVGSGDALLLTVELAPDLEEIPEAGR